MGWADPYIEKLSKGETVQFRPRGDSMTPKIKDGELVTVEPVREGVSKGDVVLCSIGKAQYLHFVTAVRMTGPGNYQYQIGNARGHTNGWVGWQKVYGKLTAVEP